MLIQIKPALISADYSKSTVKSMAMMDHTKINFDLIVELMTWLVTSDKKDLGVSVVYSE